MYKGYRVGVIIPALNEAQCVKQVIIDIQTLSQSNRPVVDEIYYVITVLPMKLKLLP